MYNLSNLIPSKCSIQTVKIDFFSLALNHRSEQNQCNFKHYLIHYEKCFTNKIIIHYEWLQFV